VALAMTVIGMMKIGLIRIDSSAQLPHLDRIAIGVDESRYKRIQEYIHNKRVILGIIGPAGLPLISGTPKVTHGSWNYHQHHSSSRSRKIDAIDQ